MGLVRDIVPPIIDRGVVMGGVGRVETVDQGDIWDMLMARERGFNEK